MLVKKQDFLAFYRRFSRAQRFLILGRLLFCHVSSKNLNLCLFSKITLNYLGKYSKTLKEGGNYEHNLNKMLKKIHTAMGLDETKWPPRKSASYINQKKESGSC